MITLIALSACKSFEMNLEAPYADATQPGTVRALRLQVNVLPSQVRESGAVDAPFRALPQSFVRDEVLDSEPVDLGVLTLVRPVLQAGRIEAYRVNPNVADVPGETLPVEGLVQLTIPDSVQTYLTAADPTGAFESWAVPGSDYVMQVIPTDPLLPMRSAPFTVDAAPRTEVIDLGAGVPVYGFVTVQGLPMSGARVQVVDALGVSSSPALTDDRGYYQLRVEPGTWTVVCEGRENNGRDPTITWPGLEVGEVGAIADFEYPPLPYTNLDGSVHDADGNPVKGTTVRLVSETLQGFDVQADWSSNVPVQDDGFFYSPVVPGKYTVEVLPPATTKGDQLTPVRLDDQVFQVDSVLHVVLSPLVRISGTVTGPRGGGLESAHVLCQELGFDQRSYQVFTQAGGGYSLDVPNVAMSCSVSPPPTDSDLATSRFTVDPTTGSAFDFGLGPGELVSGQVVLDGEIETYAVVEVRDAADQVVGSGLTDKDGRFAIPVDLKSAAQVP